jgi:hypothetical protein
MTGSLTRQLPRQGRHRSVERPPLSQRLVDLVGAVDGSLAADPVRPDLPRFAAPARRVRQQVRDGAVVVAFSAAASTGVALALLLLTQLAS